MNEIRYGQASSTFSPVLIAAGLGLFATQVLPVISQQEVTDHANKRISGVAYRTQNNASTYSHFGSPITGGY